MFGDNVICWGVEKVDKCYSEVGSKCCIYGDFGKFWYK